MLEVLKIINCFDYTDREHFFVYSRSAIRGHSKTLFKSICRIYITKFTLSNCVIDAWNSLSQDVVDSGTVNTFNNRLDKYLIGQRLTLANGFFILANQSLNTHWHYAKFC